MMMDVHTTPTDPFPELTRFLAEWHDGHEAGLAHIVSLTYQELHKLAVAHFNKAEPGDTLQPTALVSEVYVRLKANERMKFKGRTQFFWFAGQLMRQILGLFSGQIGHQTRW